MDTLNTTLKRNHEELFNLLKGFITEIIGEEFVEEMDITPQSSFTKDLEMDSIEIVSFSEKIKAHLIKEEVLWKEYKKLIIAETTKDNAALILEKNTAVLTACDELVKAYVEYAGTLPKQPNSEGATILSIAENTNTAGRQRMLSQRLTFYYAAYIWGITEQFPTEKIKSFAEFIQHNFSKLIISEVNTTDIDDALANVIADWREVEERCTKDNCYTFENKGMDVAQMFKVTSNILQKMDKITGMYAKLLE